MDNLETTTTQKTSPVQVQGFDDVIFVCSGFNTTMFVKNDGSIWAMGDNTNGNFGNGTTISSSVPVAVGSLIVMEEQPFAPEGEADVLVDESTGTDGHSALNLNFDFENGLDGWSGGGRLSGGAPLQWITDQENVQSGSGAVLLDRDIGGYFDLKTELIDFMPDHNYSFSIDLKSYGTSMYPGDQFALITEGGSHQTTSIVEIDPYELTDLGDSWIRVQRNFRLLGNEPVKLRINFAKYKPGPQYIDNFRVFLTENRL